MRYCKQQQTDFQQPMDSQPPASTEAYAETSQYVCALTYDALDVQRIITSVQDNAAGAISVFIG